VFIEASRAMFLDVEGRLVHPGEFGVCREAVAKQFIRAFVPGKRSGRFTIAALILAPSGLSTLNRQKKSNDQDHEEPGRSRRYPHKSKPCPYIEKAWSPTVSRLCAEKCQSSEDNRRTPSNDHRYCTFRGSGSPDHPEYANAGNRSNDEGAKNEKNAHCVSFANEGAIIHRAILHSYRRSSQ
jgi:hypothetical protein